VGRGVLFICGGAEHARAVFDGEERVDWSQALPLMLEKYGYLDVTTARPRALAQRLDGYAAVLVARLPDKLWTKELATRALEGPTPVYVDGPVAPAVADALGIEADALGSVAGSVTVHDPEMRSLAAGLGGPPGGRVRPLVSKAVVRDPEHDWRRIEGVPISSRQAERWRAPSWTVSRWRAPDVDRVLATWEPDDATGSSPALVQRGRLYAGSLSLLSFLGERHTSAPFDGDEHRTADRLAGLELLLLGLVDLMYRRAERSRPRVLPWPDGARWVRSVRHDYDRPISPEQAAETIRRHAEARSAATWYWRGRRAEDEALSVVASSPRHEIALHTERPWAGAEEERRVLEAALGRPVLGATAHGSPDSFRYQGAPNQLWAEDQGLRYTEVLEYGHFHPHRLAVPSGSGVIETLRVMAVPHHRSFDLNMRETQASEIRRAPARWRPVGGFLQIMNHPDIHSEEFFRVLGEMPAGDRLDWTAAEVIDWWSRTHVAGALTIQSTSSGFVLRSSAGVERLVLEVLDPDESRVEYTVDLEPGVDVEVVHDR
jgi:hypothetical protein